MSLSIFRLTLLSLVFLLQCERVSAAVADAPVVLIWNQYTFKAGAGFGVIGSLIGSNANKRAGAQMQAFAERTSGIGWQDLVKSEFACFAVPQGAPCREVLFMNENGANLDEKGLRAVHSGHAYLIEVDQMFREFSRYRARAVLQEIVIEPKRVRTVRTFTALYDSYIPRELRDGFEKSLPGAEAFWFSMSPSRLEAEARSSLRELRVLLERAEQQSPDGKVPQAWKQLPSISTLEKSGKAKCSGLPCSDVRVLDAGGERIWLVNDTYIKPSNGVTIASLDADAANHNTNLFFMVTVPH